MEGRRYTGRRSRGTRRRSACWCSWDVRQQQRRLRRSAQEVLAMSERQVLQSALSAHALAGPQGELRGGGGERRRREYGAGGRPCGHAGGTDAV
jgi:hypothetical protein